ncbi:putative ribokinase [Rosellinia necatrix]|uniref:Ribokinase n=1 Tax=Rosellinia necatrix TaxID=77044 RepID=A0A1S7UI01_ROSNE|nr:putative ribokinase [Rosellinia necatrix]
MAAEAKTPLITVLGSLNMDLVAYVSHHPLPGETMTSNSFAVSPGGKGANQAIACAKLSRSRSSPTSTTSTASASASASATAHVRMVGAVGADGYGAQLTANLSAHGVDVSGVVSSPGPGNETGVALIVVDEPTGQNRIILSPGANHSLPPASFAAAALPTALPAAPAPLLPDLLIMQLEIPLPAVLAALSAARAAGVPVLLNPAPAQPLPDAAYAGLAHLVLNETEAALLGGVGAAELEAEAGLEGVAARFVGLGVRNVIVTLGDRGVFYMTAGSGGAGGRRRRSGLVPAEKAKVVDTTAAGDTFVGQYALDVVCAAAGVAKTTTTTTTTEGDFDIEAAVRRANRAAAKTVERLGAQDSIPWRDEL